MFKLFKKKGISVSAVVDGQLIPITSVKDDVFSEKMLGDGYAIEPKNGEIYAPIAGTITTVFPTKHAIGITTKDNLEILIHLGLDTVNLKGQPFKLMVKEGDVVQEGMQLADMDLEMVKTAGYDDTIIVVYTNMDLIKDVSEIATGNVIHNSEVQTVKLND
ncbi:PTS glucose transporter subunit IIA [Lactobacillus sp. ESL0701]|uniref:PTS sugar transporter subunit IIA n=1 Tax=Lactobacillus sp. ESL0701 TaxID=2983217 RepID=UPI0023F6B9A4|nr:PTS glucose transporter subunit IIA [Lactobacillus sp. ESL0701]MDF7671761.1 PTS glucose transporter subunit IIA [Lactobacillus sp. ESL0701]